MYWLCVYGSTEEGGITLIVPFLKPEAAIAKVLITLACFKAAATVS